MNSLGAVVRWVAVILLFGPLASFAQTGDYLFSGSETNITLNPGTYDIIAYGAQGGNSTNDSFVGGLGVETEAEFNFTNATTLTLLVGGAGGGGALGGGGSFVVNGATSMVVAGGGAGAGYQGNGGTGVIQTNGASGGGPYGGVGGSGGGGGGGGGTQSGGGALGGPGGFGGGGGGGYSGGGGGWSGFAGGGGGSIIDSSAITNLAEIPGVASPDDSPNGEIIITFVPQPPSFIEQPSLTAAFTSNVTFQAVLQGTAPLSCQWYLNEAPLSDNGHYIGSMETNLTIIDFQPGDIGDYTLVVTNYVGSVTSAVATLNILNPLITSQPQSQSAVGGDTVTFSVSTTGQQPLNYQWLLNGTNLDSATNNPLILSNILVSQSGTYSVVVSNSYSAVLSSNATLTVQPVNIYYLSIDYLSGNQTVPAGSYVSIVVAAQGQQPMHYQWLLNGTNLPDTDVSELSMYNVQLDQAGPYSVIVSNYYGMATSSVVNLGVLPLAITTQPKSIITWLGSSPTFTVTAAGVPPITYQWVYNGTNFLSGNDTNFLVLSNLQASQFGNYSVIVTNNYESITSSIAGLTFSQVAVWGGTAGESNLTTGLTNIIAVTAGGPGYCLALTGSNSNGVPIGWPQAYTYYYGPSNFVDIAGAGPAIELGSSGQVFQNSDPIYGLNNIVAITPYLYQYLFLQANGVVVQSGNPHVLSNVVAVAQGEAHSMALTTNGTVVAWGSNTYGQTNVPYNLTNVIAIAAGYYHSLALTGNGTVVGWGMNQYHQTNVPAGLSNVVAIAAGGYHSLALKSDGTVVSWGLNNFGETNVPSGLTNVIAIAAGEYDSLALIGNGPPVLQIPLINPAYKTNSFSVSLPTQCGRVYSLQYKNSLTDANWIALPLSAGNGNNITVTDTNATNSQRFYRVQQW